MLFFVLVQGGEVNDNALSEVHCTAVHLDYDFNNSNIINYNNTVIETK